MFRMGKMYLLRSPDKGSLLRDPFSWSKEARPALIPVDFPKVIVSKSEGEGAAAPRAPCWFAPRGAGA